MGGETTRVENRGETTRGETTWGERLGGETSCYRDIQLVLIQRMMHLSSVIPANDTRESVFGLRNFPRHERGSNLRPLAPEQRQVLTTIGPRTQYKRTGH